MEEKGHAVQSLSFLNIPFLKVGYHGNSHGKVTIRIGFSYWLGLFGVENYQE